MTRWLQAAEDDLTYARHARDGGFFPPACFHAQQAAEKAVKAVHYARGARTVIGHSVRGLIDRLSPAAPALAALRDDGARLDLLYVPTRYPNGLAEGAPSEAFTGTQAGDAIAAAERIVAAARQASRIRPYGWRSLLVFQWRLAASSQTPSLYFSSSKCQ